MIHFLSSKEYIVSKKNNYCGGNAEILGFDNTRQFELYVPKDLGKGGRRRRAVSTSSNLIYFYFLFGFVCIKYLY